MIKLLKLIGRPVFRVLFSVEYHGIDNVPAKGAVIIAGNHPSYLDPVLVAMPIERVIRFMAWDALFRIPILGPLIKSLGAFPVDVRRGKGESAYQQALAVLKQGYALGIFPEGQRSERGPMGELRTGVARLAIDTGAPIVPVTIGGAGRAWPKRRLLPKPAKIIVRYHAPIHLKESDRRTRGDQKQYHNEVMEQVAASVNRSLTPALRGVEVWERWYRQPPSHIRTYEWVPLTAAGITTLILLNRGRLAAVWVRVWVPAIVYYFYLAFDLTVIKPSRSAKWLRNSMPIWLIFAWHYPLIRALEATSGRVNGLLAFDVLVAFFPFFWEDYYTLQKFIRGLVVVYYLSVALLLILPEPLGIFAAVIAFVVTFAIRFRTEYYRWVIGVMIASALAALVVVSLPNWVLVLYGLLGVICLLYLQTFVSAAYDIRKAGAIANGASGDSNSNSRE